MSKSIVVVEPNDVLGVPPVLNLINNLLDKRYNVTLISWNASKVSEEILNNKYFKYKELNSSVPKNKIFGGIVRKVKKVVYTKKYVNECMKSADVLWTTSDTAIRILGKTVTKYKHVFQLMELTNECYIFKKMFKLPLKKIANKAWKVVVPEINRAYIEQTWWELDRVPYVLPNKPYSLEYGDITVEMDEPLKKIKNETRKILLYLGGIWPDREIKFFAEATKRLGNEYCLYIIGKVDESQRKKFNELLKSDCVEYLGFFTPPKHLAFIQYAHIGFLPYKSVKTAGVSELNTLYCAPNKIYEYAGFNVPMLGSDIIGLRLPFEKYNIGFCAPVTNVEELVAGINEIEKNYDEMSKNCYRFYNDTDLNKIVQSILSD